MSTFEVNITFHYNRLSWSILIPLNLNFVIFNNEYFIQISTQVSVTPTRVKQMRRLDEAREPTDVFLGPFTPKATVSFLDIPVGKTARRFLTIHNKYEDEVKVIRKLVDIYYFWIDMFDANSRFSSRKSQKWSWGCRWNGRVMLQRRMDM